MSETTNDVTPAGQPIDPYDGDDVEAHGLREVAAAATIGAAVVGAGGAALAAAHTPVPRTPAIIQQAVDDANQLSGDARGGAQDLAGTTTGDAQMVAGHAMSDVHTTLDPTLHQVSGDVQTIAGAATDIAQTATHFATSTAGTTINLATSTAGAAEKTAVRAADAAVSEASKTANNAVKGATQVAAKTAKSALKVVGSVENVVNRGWDLDLTVLGANVSGGGNMLTPTGTISVTDSNGHSLGSVKLGDGKATLHLKALGHNQSVTIHYSGDKVFGPSTIHWQPPVGF